MTIRRYFINKIAAHGPGPVQFPGALVLAKQLNVTKPTVLRVVKHLIEMGILEPCAGGGTVSIPNPAFAGFKIFGFIEASGLMSFDNLYFVKIAAAAKLEIASRHSAFMVTEIDYGVPEGLERALTNTRLDYLVLIAPDPHIVKHLPMIRKTGIPVASFMHRLEGIPSVYLPTREIYRRALEALFAEGRRRVLIHAWHDPYFAPDLEEVVASTCQRAGIPRDSVTLIYTTFDEHRDGVFPTVRARLAAGDRFDGVLFYPFQPGLFFLLREHLDFKRECRVVIDELSLTRDLNFDGYVIRSDLEKAAFNLAERLLHPKKYSKYAEIDFSITAHPSGGGKVPSLNVGQCSAK